MLRLMELLKSSDLQEMVESFVEFLGPAQLQISVNGVIQKSNNTPGTITEGFKIDAGGNIEFATAPTTPEVFCQVIAEALATFDIADNELDNFTGDGNTTDFTLFKKQFLTMLVL